MKLLGLRTIIYPTHNLERDKKWWTDVTGIQPYFDQPFYVGFEVGGYELGLDPHANMQDGPITYWGVEDVGAACAAFISHGCEAVSGPQEVGDGIEVAVLRRADGSRIGLIRNPHFKVKH